MKTLAKKTAENKRVVIEQLSQYPIVMTACKKADIGRATYYKWLEEDKEFVRSVETAMLDGKRLVADMAKAQLLKLVSEGKITPIIFLLKTLTPTSRTRCGICMSTTTLTKCRLIRNYAKRKRKQ